MEVMSAKEAADKWGISQRRVAVLCSENRIKNVQMLGNMWLIPINAEKPVEQEAQDIIIKQMRKMLSLFLNGQAAKGSC